METDFRTMDADEYRAAIDKLGLTQVDAARMLHVVERTSRNWALGERPVPPATAALLRVMLKYKITPEQLAKINQKGPKR